MSHNHENNNINSLHYVPPHIHKKVWVTVPDYKKIDEIFEKKNNYKLDNSINESRNCNIGDSYNYCDKDEFVCKEHSERKCNSYTYNNCDGCAEDCSECSTSFYSSISNLYKSDENTCEIIDMEDDDTLFYNISVIDKIFKEYKIKDRVLINIFKRLNKSMRARNNLRIIENLQSFIVRLDVIDNNELYQEIMYEINIIKDTKKNEIIETIPTGIFRDYLTSDKVINPILLLRDYGYEYGPVNKTIEDIVNKEIEETDKIELLREFEQRLIQIFKIIYQIKHIYEDSMEVNKLISNKDQVSNYLDNNYQKLLNKVCFLSYDEIKNDEYYECLYDQPNILKLFTEENNLSYHFDFSYMDILSVVYNLLINPENSYFIIPDSINLFDIANFYFVYKYNLYGSFTDEFTDEFTDTIFGFLFDKKSNEYIDILKKILMIEIMLITCGEKIDFSDTIKDFINDTVREDNSEEDNSRGYIVSINLDQLNTVINDFDNFFECNDELNIYNEVTYNKELIKTLFDETKKLYNEFVENNIKITTTASNINNMGDDTTTPASNINNMGDDTTTTASNIERFINLEKNSNNNLLIKTAIFTILFYILTSKKSSELIKNILGKMSKNNYSLIMILIFSVFYYIINTLI